MSIAKRLYMLLWTAVAALVILSGMGIFVAERIFQATNYSNENTVPSLIILNQIATEYGQQRLYFHRHIISNDSAEMASFESKINEAIVLRDKAFKVYETDAISDDKDRQLLQQELAEVREFDAVMRETLAISAKHQKEQARELLMTSVSKKGSKLRQLLDEHIAYNQELGEKGAQQARDLHSNSRTISIVIAAVVALGLLIVGFGIVRGIRGPLEEMVAALGKVEKGDLSVRLEPGRQDEIGLLKSSLGSTLSNLRTALAEINRESDAVASSAQNLSMAARQMVAGSAQQSESTTSAAAALEELTVSIDHVGQSADDASKQAREAEEDALASGNEVDRASVQISQVAERVESSAEQIGRLSEQVQQIGSITTVIRDVADQTNLLALNAAIEAARAGEQGRGFAVVADEVRKLAERTTQAVQEISTMISSIQGEANRAVGSMQDSRGVVGEVVQSADKASNSMRDIQQSTATVQSAVTDIVAALNEQRSASSDLARNVESVAQMSEENLKAASSVEKTADSLVGVSNQLKSSVARFSF